MEALHQTRTGRQINIRMRSICVILIFSLIVASYAISAAQTSNTLRGRVLDQFQAVIVNATVVLTDASGQQRKSFTAEDGRYTFNGLPNGVYVVRIEAKGFASFEKSVEVNSARTEVNAQLEVGLDPQSVSIEPDSELTTAPENNRNALVLRGDELEALPSDPEELAAALQALAGVPAAPDGGQILIDGFLNTGQPLPPASSIREVRINANPFSAENDRLGFGQIQIVTRPGTEKFRGQLFFNFNDESLNARNPFALRRAPYQMRYVGGNVSGPIANRRASFFFSYDHRHTDDNAIINAIVLNPNLVPEPFIRTLIVPRDQVNLLARLDAQLNTNHTINTRYSFYRNQTKNAGVGGLSLFDRAFSFSLPIHTFQLTETAVITNRLINEFRLQYIGEDQINTPVSSLPAVTVQGSFSSGGSVLGNSRNPEGRLTLQNSLLWTVGPHTVRAGARLRRTTMIDIAPDYFNGAFVFHGGFAPQLAASGEPVLDTSGQTIPILIDGLERYRRTLFFSQRMLSAAEIRARGGGATQLFLAGGDPRETASQIDFGSYVQDDWKAAANFTVSFGLRAEFQTNIPFKLSLAPRVAFAWGLNDEKTKAPKTVIRGGFGIFFDRLNENQVLVVKQFQAGNSKHFIFTDPQILDSFPHVPAFDTVGNGNTGMQSMFQIADDLRVPYLMQGALGVERQLPLKTTITATVIGWKTLHALRTRNLNAPVILHDPVGNIISNTRPRTDAGNISRYESSGRVNQIQLFVTVNSRLNRRATFFANYTLNKAMSDTDGFFTLPANSYDLSTEYGRSIFDVRHTFSSGGSFDAPWGFKLSPLIFASSGRPFNIITGVDSNEDAAFTERPSFATDLNRSTVRMTNYGTFDLAPLPGQRIIPRNFGTGPGYFIVNLNLSRTFILFRTDNSTANTNSSSNEGRFRLTFAVRVLNLFNRANFDVPVGNLSSPFFGQSVMTTGSFGAASVGNPAAGNRRIESQLRFEF